MEGVGIGQVAMTPGGISSFDNASVWRNITMWTAQHLGKAVNMSKLAPSLEDLVWAGPRMVMKIGSFISFPDSVEGFGQRVIPEATDPALFVAAATSQATSYTPAAPAAADTLLTDQDPNAFVTRFSLEGAKGLGSVFGYITSKWALSCVAMAVVFNRTNIFAATRRRLRLRWSVRLLLRITPVLLLLIQARTILQSIQCQTSPDFAELRWGNSSKSSDLMFSQDNALLHGLSSTLLFGATDEESCQAVKMVPRGSQEQSELRGSLSRLWPVFGTFCLSQFIEVLSCTVQGRPTATETGMTLFEHSLAFAEADAAVSNQLGWGLFTNGTASSSRSGIGSTIAVTRTMILRRVNTSPEVLLMAFFSCMSHVTSHMLGLFGLQARYRLISTGVWALCFMGSIVWSIITFSLDDTSSQGLLRFPTVCIIGFIPHVLVLTGIVICGFIYFMALILSALAAPTVGANGRPLRLVERLYRAHRNMQANVTLSDIRIRLDMDFYTALLRAGFGAITMASEAVYLNEDRRVVLGRRTWLENSRMREIEELKMQWAGSGMPGSRFDTVGTIGLVPVQEGHWNATSGYAREKAAQKVPKSSGTMRRIRDGVGAAERRSRWLVALEYLAYVNKLLVTAWAIVVLRLLAAVGVRNPPQRLRWLARQPKGPSANGQQPSQAQSRAGEDWLSVPGRTIGFVIPRTDEIDVEDEVRRHLVVNVVNRREVYDEVAVDTTLYDWFTRGGWWGARDTSGDYAPPPYQGPDDNQNDSDFDATSVVSASDAGTDQDLDWLDDGQCTPTQWTSGSDARASRDSTPLVDAPISMSDLARLLHPSSPEERDEAQALAAHLSSDRVMTRAGYQAHQHRRRAELLLSSRQHFRIGAAPMSPDEEAVRLEQILLSRRRASGGGGSGGSTSGASASWATGAPGLGSGGPECVVCQSAPRTIIVWPCRCLSLCDDCRVSLAMNNFDKCVCCRREVISFSRIYVP